MFKKLFTTWRKRFAEWIHPETDNADYWLAKSLQRDSVHFDAKELKKSPAEIKALGQTLKRNELLHYWINVIGAKEEQFMALEATKLSEFNYSRAVIHILHTLVDKLKEFDDKPDLVDEFDKFKVI